MPSYRLTYYNARGRAETARLLFAVKGQDYVDRRMDQAEWDALKPESPMGQVPYLEVDSKLLGQSCAIARYLANEFGLMGRTPFEAAQIDSIVELTNDLYPGLWMLALKYIFNQPEKSAQLKVDYDKKVISALQNLDKVLKLNNNKTAFFIGSEISLADVHFYSVAEILMEYEEYKALLEPYPTLEILMQNTKNYPQIKNYLAKRTHTVM